MLHRAALAWALAVAGTMAGGCRPPAPVPLAPLEAPRGLPAPAEEGSAREVPSAPAAVEAPPNADEGSGPGTAPEVADQPPDAAQVPDGGTALPCGDVPEGMACVPAGWYLRGVDEDTHRCEQMGQPRDGRPMSSPSAQVWLDTFWIDRTEVTVAAWHACVEAGACERVRALYPGFSDPDQPMTGQDWFQSLAYCQWRGATLPTEAQWEAAARGPAGTTFPWGEEPADCDRAILEDGRGRSCGRRQPGSTPERGRVWPVASLPAGHFGLFDMAGNAEEWVMDWWTPDWDACGEACAPVNPRGPCEGSETCPGRRYRVIRGGSWYWDGSHATGWHRRRHTPDNRPPHHFGFRCARVAGDAAD